MISLCSRTSGPRAASAPPAIQGGVSGIMPDISKSQLGRVYMGCRTYIVASEDANDFAVAVEFAEDPLLHVLFGGKSLAEFFVTKPMTHLLQFWLSLRHLGMLGTSRRGWGLRR